MNPVAKWFHDQKVTRRTRLQDERRAAAQMLKQTRRELRCLEDQQKVRNLSLAERMDYDRSLHAAGEQIAYIKARCPAPRNRARRTFFQFLEPPHNLRIA